MPNNSPFKTPPKKSDEFISFVDKLVLYAHQRSAVLLFVSGVVLLVMCGTFFWRYFHSNQEQKIAKKTYEIKKNSPEEQKHFYSDLIKQQRYAPIGIWTSLELSNLHIENCDEIIKILEDYLGHGESVAIRGLTYLKVGACLEDKKQWVKAVDVYERAYGDAANPLKDFARLRLAYVLKVQSKHEEAQKLLKELSQENTKANPLVRDEARLALLTYALASAESLPSAETKSEIMK